jgi:hypothetical protein
MTGLPDANATPSKSTKLSRRFHVTEKHHTRLSLLKQGGMGKDAEISALGPL